MSSISDKKLRDDLEIFKTQVAIVGWISLVLIVILICGLIYVFFSIRKLRKEYGAKISNLEATRRFTIGRPKVYSSSDPTSKLQGEITRAVSIDSESRGGSRGQPSPLPLSPLSPNRGPTYVNQGFQNQNPSSPGLNNYSNLNTPNIHVRSPSGRSENTDENRVESFLNRARQLYSPSRTEPSPSPSPRTQKTPNGNGKRDTNFFQFS